MDTMFVFMAWHSGWKTVLTVVIDRDIMTAGGSQRTLAQKLGLVVLRSAEEAELWLGSKCQKRQPRIY
jgi:hypothetical protein